MSRVLIDQLRVLARRLWGPVAGRQDSTRKFWLIARQLRAALPPLLLAVRSGGAQQRVGYLLGSVGDWPGALQLIEREHASGDEAVNLYLHGDFRRMAALGWARVVDLNALNEIQAARLIAEDDLDLLVDMNGQSLPAMPLLIAMHPARRVIEPAFAPSVSGAASAVHAPVESGDSQVVLRLVRAVLDSLPHGEEGPEPPSSLNAQLNRGIQMHQAGELDAARSVYQDVLGRCPQHAIAAYLLGQLLHQQQDPELAIAWLRKSVAAAPEFRDAHYTLGQRLAEAKRWHEAAASYRRALDLTPGFAAAWSGLGLASLRIDPSSRSAISYLERAAALEPEVAQWSFNLGSGLQRVRDPASARTAYERAVELDPDHHDALFNLAGMAQDAGDLERAIDGYRRVLDRLPDFEPAYVQLGAALLQAGRIDDWLDTYRRYRAHCAESLSMAVFGLEASLAEGNPAEHASWRDRILAGNLPHADAEDFVRNWEQLLFLLLHVDVDRQTLLQCYRSYDDAAREWYGRPSEPCAVRRPGPLRIGYLSGDLRDHVMGRMIYELVGHHDRNRFQTVLYSLSRANDEWTDHFRALGFKYVELAGMSHDSAAARIQADDIDVLVDCCGHTRGAQPGILALKPARIIATHIATPGPVGLQTIDYKLTDEYAEAADAQEFSIEQLWRVSGGVFPWHRYAEPEPLTREALGIDADRFVCGAFVSLMKLSPRCLRLWKRILERLPNAVLAFSPPTPQWQPAYLRWLQAHDISAERVAFIPWRRGEPAALARHRILDVALDPTPCGNVNGTMEALASGVPVVTLAGTRHGERLGNTLLNRFGITDTVAHDELEYIELVCRLAVREQEWTKALRARICKAALDSPVWDSVARTRSLEAAFEQMAAAHAALAAD